jgi:DNA-binding protein
MDENNTEQMQDMQEVDSQQMNSQQMHGHSNVHEQRPRTPRAPGEENTIFIGRKSTMGYVLAVVTQFNSGAPVVKVKARGKLISKAVDVAEISKGRFLPDIKPSNIIIMTEEVQNEDGTKSKVSSIEISLSK